MSRLRGLIALVVLGGLVGAVPWALVRFGRWPINGVPSGDQLRDLGDAVVSDTAVLAVLTVAAWLVWLVFTVSVVVEASASVRGIQAPRLAFAGPVQRSARGLVASVVIALTIQHSPPPATAGLRPISHVSDLAVATSVHDAPVRGPVAAEPPVERNGRGQRAPAGALITVGVGDNAWSIAETHLGDGMRWRELWETNRAVVQPDGRTWADPQVIRAGWQLRLPSDSIPTVDAAQPAGPEEVVHTVVPGDTLWEIADDDLGDADRYPEIFEANRDVVQPDGRHLTDPDLILPGWDLRLPDAAPDQQLPPETPAASPEDPDQAPVPTTETPTPDTTPTTVPAAVQTSASSTTSTTATPLIDAPARVDSESGRSEGDSVPLAPTLAGVAGAVVLASGLALRIRFLRRRRATRGARALGAVSTGTGQTEDAVVAAADVPLARWAGQHLAQLVGHLDRRAVTGAPVAVELSDSTGIELLWDSPQPDAPGAWTVADGGWAWRLAYDPDAPVPVDALPAAIPALVTIGHRDGRQFMVDLEAYGAIMVSGTDARVDAFLRSVALELAAGQDLADAYVHAVGFDPGVGQLDRLGTADLTDALRRLDGVRRSVTDALDVAKLDGSFAARTGSPTPIEATVVIARPTEATDAERLLQAAPPHRGVAVVVAGDAGAAPAHIDLRDDGTARIEPLGIVFTPAALPADSATELDALLDALDAPPAIPDDGHQHVPDGQRGDGAVVGAVATNGHLSLRGNGDEPAVQREEGPAAETGDTLAGELFPADSDGEDIEPALLVRVLGTPAVLDRPGLGRRELILTVLLACRRRPVAASAAQDALWGGKPVESKTVWNVIGATRKALGDLADGTPVMPSADRARSTLRVARGVVTDLALLNRLVEQARQVPSSEAIGLLREGLDLVVGPPFDAAGYDWAHRDQDVAEACTLIEHATERLVDLALAADLIDVARDAIVRGLRGLPGNEELYRCRMRVEHCGGNLPGVSAAYEELVTYLADLETEPSPSTTALYEDLVRPARR
ncbi:MAG: LysM peptidoglycan-binding domain-containing protein [Acidimicrobiales bacterium]